MPETPSPSASFSELGLMPPLVKALTDMGYTHPTPIQSKVIPSLLSEPKNMIALAQTGTGKTASFGLPLLSHMDEEKKYVQALIICPTRELCIQIWENLGMYAKYMPSLRSVAVYGGSAMGKQITELKKGAQIIVATPGRLKDLIDRGVARLENVRYVVLDEADEMLNMGFREDIYYIFKPLPKDKYVWLFSATMQADIRVLVRKIMPKPPEEIQITPANTTNKNIVHRYFLTRREHKYEALERLLLCAVDFHTLVFCKTKNDTQQLAYQLKKNGFEVDYLNGDMAQNEREAIMHKYKNHLIKILVATDVAARGMDVPDITHVINYELPDDIEVYTHRSGRTARAGKAGFCYSILSGSEVYKIGRIEAVIKDKIAQLPIPTSEEVRQALLTQTTQKIKTLLPNAQAKMTPHIHPLIEDFPDYDTPTWMALIYKILLGEKLQTYAEKPDINLSHNSKIPRLAPTNARSRFRSKGLTNMCINLGKKDGMGDKSVFIAWLAKELPLPRGTLGKIIIRERVAFFEIPNEIVNKSMAILERKIWKGRKIKIGRA